MCEEQEQQHGNYMSTKIIKQFQREIFFTTTVINSVSTIVAESSDVASAEVTDDFSMINTMLR